MIALSGLDAAVTIGPPVVAAAFGAGTDGLGVQLSAGLVSAAVVLATLLIVLSGRHRSPAAAE
jgi:Na+/melibiose symporter-like transporter